MPLIQGEGRDFFSVFFTSFPRLPDPPFFQAGEKRTIVLLYLLGDYESAKKQR